jgi:hypothetical protein
MFMGVRRKRKDRRRAEQVESRIINGKDKNKERERRQQRLREKVQAGPPPYTPTVMSWLSHELDKPSTAITPDDVKQWLATVKG